MGIVIAKQLAETHRIGYSEVGVKTNQYAATMVSCRRMTIIAVCEI